MQRLLATVSVLAAAASGFGQSFNVDINSATGAGAGVPSNAFLGAAGVGGAWNGVGTSTSTALVNTAGNLTNVTLTRTGGGTLGNGSSGALGGDFEKLLEDHFRTSTGVTATYTFTNLQAGTYALYTYAINPASQVTSIVNVAGSTSRIDQQIGSFMMNESFFAGATHALHVKSIPAGGSFAVTIAPPSPGDSAYIAGFQLVKLSTPLLRIHVKGNAVGAETGSDWANAFTHPQTALHTARYAGGQNTEVWVATGVYKPTSGTDRSISFRIPDHLKFYGGFNGTETAISQRPPGVGLTYLHGDIGSTSSDTDNSYVVVVADMTSPDTVIDGFRIHKGYNNAGGIDGGHGGGMRLQGGNATVRNCTFVDNVSSNYGGGVYVDYGQPKFVNCLFYRNEAFAGAALYHSDQLPIQIFNCRFHANSSFEGAVHFANSDGLIANSVFTGNYAGGSGAAVHGKDNNSQVTIANCTIAGNNAGQVVGGVFVRNGADATLHNTILWANQDQFSQTMLEKQYGTSGAGSTITTWAITAQGASGSPGLDPLFVDGNGADNVWGTLDDNCRLQEASPAIEGGSNDNLPFDTADVDGDGNVTERLPLDLDGNTRVRGVVVDRGAYEYQNPCSLAGDLNGSGAVDLSDLTALLSHFGMPSGATYAMGDVDGDGAVTLNDLTILLSTFGSSCP